MKRHDVDGNDMLPSDSLDDRAVEAFLSGHRSGDLGEPLAAFADELEAVASGPAPTPKADLAALLRDGFSPGSRTQGAPLWATPPGPAGTAPPVRSALPEEWAPVPRPPLPVPSPEPSRRLRLIPRLAGLGLAAKLGLGVGVAAASVTGAGAAGVLPDPAQDVVATVFDTVTPFDFPATEREVPTVNSPRRGTGGAGVDGRGPAAEGNGITGDVEGPGPSAGGGQGVGPSGQGATGLDRANETPAAGNVPTSVPAPSGGVAPGQQGLDRANETPAAGNVPASVPAPGPADAPGQRGRDRARPAPAGGPLPTTTTTTTTTVPPRP